MRQAGAISWALAGCALSACAPRAAEPARAPPTVTVLPGATHAIEGDAGADVPLVGVTATEVRLDGKIVGDPRSIATSRRPTRVDPLFEALRARRDAWKNAHPGAAFPGVVALAIDPETHASVVKSVFMTAAFAGYPNARFAVRTATGSGFFMVDAQVPGARSGGGIGTTNGRLDPKTIQATLRAHFHELRACYEQGLARDPSLRGRVVTGFVIQGDGTVLASSVADAGSTLVDPDVIACVEGVLAALSFPRPEGGLVTVVYPVVFDAGK